jgi:RNA polymerase sigma-70 factor (family 1)
MNVMYITYSDENILALIGGSDDEAAFAELYDRYFQTLFNYVFSKVNDQFAAQEIVQELFVSIWQQRHRNQIQVCRPYLFSIAKKLIITFYRKEFTRQRHYSQWEIQRDELGSPADQTLLTHDLQHHYEEGLHLLSPKCKEVFLLSRQGNSNREISLLLKISEKTVEQHISKALRVLKAYLREHLAFILFLLLIL